MSQPTHQMGGATCSPDSASSRKDFGGGRLIHWIADRLVPGDVLMLLPECIATILVIVVIWGGIALLLQQQYNTARDAAVRDTANLARAFEENTERIVAGIDEILLSMRTDYARNPAEFDLLDWQRHHTRTDRFTVQFGMIGPDGFVTGSSLEGVADRRIDVSDREHFKVHLDPARDELFISEPVLGRGTGKWTLQFTRKLLGPGGRFAGVLVVSLGCEELSKFYNTLDIGRGFVTLVGADGIVRARGPLREGAIGTDLGAAPAFAQFAGLSHGSYQAISGIDHRARIISFRRLRDLPLVVLVGFDTADVFGGYVHTRSRAIWIGGIATGIVLLLGGLWIALRQRWIESKRLLQLTFDTVNQGIVMVGADGQASVVNRRALRLLDLPMKMLSHPGAISWPAMPPARRSLSRKGGPASSSAGQPALEAVTQIVQQDGKVIEVQNYPTSLGGFVLTYTDITERRLAEARILHTAHHDPLTDLPNRLLLNECIARAVEQEGRSGSYFAIFGLDLDGFKTINDTMGHDAGDLVLCRFAERLRRLVGPEDIAARTGGDEFTVLVGGLAGPADAERAARRLFNDLAFSVDLGGSVFTLSCSIGIAVFPVDGTDGRALLKNADTALYQAKGAGKGSFRRFEHWMDQSLAERRALENDLRQAVADDALDVYFQPQFGCATLNLVGFEALVRWRHAKRGFVPPDVFIPIAEECGLIGAIGCTVLERACTLAAGWRPPLRIAVNLSPVQFRGDGLLAKVSDILRRTAFPANLLELEITEGVLIKEETQALNTLCALKELGVSIALDDFGTGYSSLSYLRRFPFDKIKIDKSFVWAQQQDAGTRTILEAVLAMSSRLNLSVIAEGIETREQLALLREQGCPEVQGFLLGRPMPAAEVDDFIRSVSGEDARDRSHLWLAASKATASERADYRAA